MPTYEYACAKCGHQFEKVQPMSGNALTVCPKDLCAQKKWGKGKVKRMISTGGGLLFKGTGFYITDYRSEKYKQAAKKDAPATKESAAPASSDKAKPTLAKTESKPAKSTAKT